MTMYFVQSCGILLFQEQFLKNEIINSLVLMFGEEARNPIDVVFHVSFYLYTRFFDKKLK